MYAHDAANPDQRPSRADPLTVVALASEHAVALFPLLNDWEVVRSLAEAPWPLELADVQNHAARASEGVVPVENFVVSAAEKPIGVVSLKPPGSGDPPRTMPRLGYWLGRAYWSRGLGTEAVAWLLDYAHARFPGQTVGAGVFADNPASRRVLEKLGFRQVRTYDTFCRSRGVAVACRDMHLDPPASRA
jgi:RimJ/RimL family protein N-acetyltransferase